MSAAQQLAIATRGFRPQQDQLAIATRGYRLFDTAVIIDGRFQITEAFVLDIGPYLKYDIKLVCLEHEADTAPRAFELSGASAHEYFFDNVYKSLSIDIAETTEVSKKVFEFEVDLTLKALNVELTKPQEFEVDMDDFTITMNKDITPESIAVDSIQDNSYSISYTYDNVKVEVQNANCFYINTDNLNDYSIEIELSD